MRVLITGDSHTAALYLGQQAIVADKAWPRDLDLAIRPLGGGHLTCEPFFLDRGDHAGIVTPEFKRNFDRLPTLDDGGDTVYGLSAPLHSVRFWRHPDWQRLVPATFGLRGAPISSGVMRRAVLDDQRYTLLLLAILIRAGRRVFVVEPPHPFRHHPALRETPPSLVLHLNAFYRRTVLRELDAMGVRVVHVPEYCLEDGFMRAEYGKAGDPHHGNATYGRAMMSEIVRFLSGPNSPAASGVSPDSAASPHHSEMEIA